MIKNLKNNKKKGFTLVELVVVIAIIAILAAVLIPQITGFIEESRKTEVIQEARELITAVDSVNAKQGSGTLDNQKTIADIKANTATEKLVAWDTIDKISPTSTMKIEILRQILNTDKYKFDLTTGDKLKEDSVKLIKASAGDGGE